MRVRKLEEKDYLIIKEMLRKEHAEDEYPYVIKAETYVMEDNDIIGFFGYRMEHDYPSLKHFCLDRKHRGLGNACKLMREYLNTIKKVGYNKSFFSAGDKTLIKLLEWYFKMKPYTEKDGIKFYFQEV
jgi:hypothetical protein